ncbi:hypothetical protein SLS53_001773 [Cytospora paraplurivora]|uniref:FAD-binding domain-containing protein n=1 Tax=Cytospora paraplurivora TaxID=2898453 RepID=A0AAN9URQ0_9PEZI
MALLMFHRAQLVQAFYEGLRNEDQARIHTGKKLATIENTSDGVIVTCADGSIYEGSIVLGADGVHSPTRKILRELALRTNPDADVDEEVPFSVEYKTMWCSVPRRYEFAPGDACSTHAEAASVQYLVASKRSWIFIYEKLDRPTRERVSYTKADIEAFAAKHGEIPLGDGVKVKDMFPHRTNCGMSNLEEGVLRQWSAGRIVLAGDACHKFTPNAGLGLNNGIQDIVALVNELHRCLQAVGTGGGLPGQDELGAVFGRYQERRRAAAQRDLEQSAQVTRLSAWPNRIYWFLDQWILPNIPGYNEIITRYRLSPSIAEGLCLDFVEGEEPFVGRVPWVHPIPNST